MSALLELDSPLDRFYYSEFLEPRDLYQPRTMSNIDSLTMYEPWDWKTAELLTGFSRPPQLPTSIDDEYELLESKMLESIEAPSYIPYPLDVSRIVPSSEQDSEETPPAPEPPPRKTSLYGKGNNPFGSRGCESCAPCRRRKGRCEYNSKDGTCSFCQKMGHVCGPKLTKTEFQLMQSGKPCPRIRCSDIAKELEKEYPDLEPQEIQIRVGERLKEIESKRKELELQRKSGSPSSSTGRSPSQATTTTMRTKRRRITT